jgi:hypothetical protein
MLVNCLNDAMADALRPVPATVDDPAYAWPVVALTIFWPAIKKALGLVFVHGLDGPVIAVEIPPIPVTPTNSSLACDSVGVVPDDQLTGVAWSSPALDDWSNDPPAPPSPATSKITAEYFDGLPPLLNEIEVEPPVIASRYHISALASAPLSACCTTAARVSLPLATDDENVPVFDPMAAISVLPGVVEVRVTVNEPAVLVPFLVWTMVMAI